MARVLVFDSGVGGLSILQAMRKSEALKHNPPGWLFCSDNAFFPYGIKKEDVLVARVTQVLRTAQQAYQPDIIVLACNTASTIALDAVRAQLDVPIVGVVPAIKPAAQLTQSGCIGLLATPGTIARSYTQQLIDEFANQHQIVKVGSSDLVMMAEQYLLTGMVDHSTLHHILTPLRNAIAQQGLDTVVLACTHFPLLIAFLREQLPEVKHWVDSGDAIARRVAWLLEQPDTVKSPSVDIFSDNTRATHVALFTRLDHADDYNFQRALQHFGLTEMRHLDIPPST